MRMSVKAFLDSADDVRRPLPGLVASVTIAMAATFVSEHYGGPTLLFALLIGMSLHFLSQDTVAAAGISFTTGTVLRIGVALLGARISAGQIADLGLVPVAAVIGGVSLTILLGRLLARPLGLSAGQGVLTGGAVAICGASAALAISVALPQSKDSERDTLFTVIAVTTLSTVAMIVYPLLVRALGLPDEAAGVLLGGTIHDVAQVVGAGYLISEQAGTVATYVKLLRVATLIPVVMVVAWSFGRPAGRGRVPTVPAFLLAFAAFATANSLGFIPQVASEKLAAVSRWCLVVAIAALGIKTSLQELTKVGWRPVALVAAETIFLLTLVTALLLVTG